MQRYAATSFLSVTILLVIFASIPSSIGALSWTIRTVDENACSSGFGTACPIVVDYKNVPHIAYTSTGEPWRAVYASWTGSKWETQTVAENSIVQCLALDSDDNPHIIYLDRESGSFKYASWTGSKWSIQDTGIKDGYFFALDFDSADNPHMAYTSSSTEGYAINYANWKGTRWESNPVATSEGREVSFTLDSHDKPNILYSPSSYPDTNLTVGIRAITVRLASLEEGNWSIQTLSLPPPTGKIGNIVIDSKDNLHLICVQHYFVSEEDKTILSTIMYASSNGTKWDTQVVTRDIVLQSLGQLVLDANDNPHFTYLTPAADGETSSYYACMIGNAWATQKIETSGGRTASGGLAIDSSGHPHICSRRSSGMPYTAPLLYTTAEGTIDVPAPTVENTQNNQTTPYTTYLIITATAVTLVAVGVSAFVLQKKRRSKS